MSIVEKIIESGIVSVIRGAKLETIDSIVLALYRGGIRTVEVTIESPNSLACLEMISAKYGDKMIIGAGTVLDSESARAAILAGADFIFAPTVNVETIRMTKRYGKVCIPGAFSPTEILTAYENGADLVKVFPAHILGPSFIKDIHGPLPQIPLMPTGGVDLSNAADYIKAGAAAVGIGSSLVNAKMAISEEELKHLQETAASYIEVVRHARRKMDGLVDQ